MQEKIKTLKELIIINKYYNVKLANKCISLCDEFLKNRHFQAIHELYVVTNAFVSNIETTKYNLILMIIDALSDVQLLFLKETNINENQKLKAKIEYMNNNTLNAGLLAMLGIPAEAFNYLERSLIVFSNKYYCEKYPINEWNQAIIGEIPEAREIVLKFASIEFYVMRHLGFQFDQCHYLYRKLYNWVKVGVESKEEDTKFLCYYGSLLANCQINSIELARDIINKLERQFEIERKRNGLLAIGIVETIMSNLGKKMGENIELWAQKGLSIKEIIKLPEKKTYLTIAALINKDKLEKELIKKSLIEYISYIDSVPNKLIRDQQKQRLSEFVLLPIRKAIEKKEYAFAIECAYIWKTSSNSEILLNEDEAILLSIPNLEDYKMVYIYYQNKEAKYFELDREISLSQFIENKNDFERTWNVVIGDKNVNIHSCFPITGVPNITKDKEYYDALNQFFVPHKIAEKLNCFSNIKTIRVLELTALNTPVISLIQQHIDICMSYLIADKLEEYSEIKKVLIWCDPDSTLYDASLECEALQETLLQHNIKFDTFTFDKCTKERFINKYKDITYDVIWIMCHGNYNSDNPAYSSLKISKHESISLCDLSELTPSRGKKRLLVLNACETAITSIRFNSMSFLGLSTGLTTNFQSVLGHYWSVDSFASAVLGNLFLIHLVNGFSPANSLMKAQKDMILGKNYIYETLANSTNNAQLVQSILNRDLAWDKLIYWGSPGLYE